MFFLSVLVNLLGVRDCRAKALLGIIMVLSVPRALGMYALRAIEELSGIFLDVAR